jgi:hypothetical protein
MVAAAQPIYFCRTEGFTERYGIPKWPDSPPKEITFHTVGGLSASVNSTAFRDSFVYAVSCFPTICGARLVYTSNRRTANIVAYAAPLGTSGFGRPGGILADSELPINLRSNEDDQLDQRYDGENWSSLDFAPQGQISLTVVIRHEVCHALGLPHGGNDLMAPTLNRSIAFPGAWTITELVRRYGTPLTPTSPPTTPTGLTIRLPGGIIITSPSPISVDGHTLTRNQ